jgi:hypothetical protein
MRRGKLLAIILLVALVIPVVSIAANDEVIVFKGGQKAVVVENKIYFLDPAGKRVSAAPGRYQTPDGSIFIVDNTGNYQRGHERW